MTQETTLAEVREVMASCISAMKDQNSVIVTIAYVEANAALAKLDAMPDRIAELEAEVARWQEAYDLAHEQAMDNGARLILNNDRIAELEAALLAMLHAVCGETGFANAVRSETQNAYPWPALDIAEEVARAAIKGATKP